MTSDGAVGSRTVSTSSRPGANVASICFLSSYGRRMYSMRRTGAWRTDREQAKRACRRRAAGKWQAPGLRREGHSGAGNQEAVAGIRGSDYVLGKAAESLTDGQRARLDIIRKDDPRLCRTYCLKEFLHLLLKTTDLTHAESDLKHGLW